jgi:glutathione-regulated potassium-efflux system ancillary protein KefC/glutathione-regulated potassium-efflux system protein KefB
MVQRPFTVLGLVVGLMAVKSLLLYGLGRAARQSHGAAVNLALFISQGGEFAFILFSVAASAQVLDRTLADLLIVVVSVSMTVTPLLVTLNEKIFKIGHGADKPEEFDKIEAHEHASSSPGSGASAR